MSEEPIDHQSFLQNEQVWLFKQQFKNYWQRQPIVFSVASLTIAIIVIIGAARIYSQKKLEYSLNKIEQETQELKDKEQAAFQELIANQAENNKNDVASFNKTTKEDKLLGTKKVHFVFVKAPETSANAPQALLNTLTDPTINTNASLWFLNTYLQEEAAKYQNPNFNLEIVMHEQVVDLPDLKKVGDVANPWGKDPFSNSNLQDSFEQVLYRDLMRVDKDDAVLFFYFDPSITQSIDVSQSFYDHKAFRSFADQESKRIYINVYSLSPSFAPRLTEIAIHEFLHLYGANDKYLETEYGCTDEGRGDTDKRPALPQTTADIMCGLVEISRGEYERASLEDKNLVINQVTAKEIGWLD